MNKVDLKKEFAYLYHAKRKPEQVTVPAMNFLMIDGRRLPDQPEFQQAAQTLYPVAYTLKFMIREQTGIDYGVLPMEVLWNVNREKHSVAWTMLLMQPEWVTPERFTEALQRVRTRFPETAVERLRLESLEEGRCAQMLHVGPYAGMDDSLKTICDFIHQAGCSPANGTHDIYLNDVRKTRPENLRAIMRVKILTPSGDPHE